MKRKTLKCSGKFSDFMKLLKEVSELEEFNHAISYFSEKNAEKLEKDLEKFRLKNL